MPSAFSAPSTPSFAAGARHTAVKYAEITSGATFTGVVEEGALASAEAGALLEAEVEDDPDEQALSPRNAVPTRTMAAVRFTVEVMQEG